MKLPPTTCKEPGKPYTSRKFNTIKKFTKKPCTTKNGWKKRLIFWLDRKAECASIRWHYSEYEWVPQ